MIETLDLSIYFSYEYIRVHTFKHNHLDKGEEFTVQSLD